MTKSKIVHGDAVTVSLEDLQNDCIPFEQLEAAFGPSSLGILLVKDLPEKFAELRLNLLSYSSYLANLPKEELGVYHSIETRSLLSDFSIAKLEIEKAKWLVGWSCGKEKLKNGKADTLKGSYYVNCSPDFAETMDQARILAKYPALPEYTAGNIWPPEEVLPGFAPAFQDLCHLVIEVAVLVARQCDRYGEAKIDGYRKGYLEHVVSTSHASKARLLHYFAPPRAGPFGKIPSVDEDDWCATHVDHGCLTGLTSAMFIDEQECVPKMENGFMPLAELPGPPDARAGLYIESRAGQTVKVSIPRDCLAFQTGQTLELITKGKFKAVPHFVRGAAMGLGGSIARNTLAVFTQPNLWEMVDDTRDFATFAKQIVDRNH